MKTKQLIAALSGLVLAACWQVAAAKGPSYTYGEIGYMHFDADNYDGNGGRVNISYGATDHIFVSPYAIFGLTDTALDVGTGATISYRF